MTRGTAVRNIAIFLSLAFLFFRFYNIRESLFFFNDIGRDFLVLLDWQRSGKPPLLGPQTSALPFNQSAWYYYSFYPLFLLTGGSPYSTLLTNAVVYLAIFWLGLYLVRSKPYWQRLWLVVFALMVIHPQFIGQNRFVWNPSYLGPLLSLAIIAYLRLRQKFELKLVVLHGLALAFAVSMNYSAAPLAVAFIPLWFWQWRRRGWLLLATTFAGGVLANLGLLISELRHDFQITRAVLRPQAVIATNAPLLGKLIDLPTQLLGASTWFSWLLLGLMVLVFVVYQRQKKEKALLSADFFTLLWLLGLTIAITLLSPLVVQKHYIFAMLTAGFFVIAALPKQISLLIVMLLASYWLRPQQIRAHFAKAPRTVAQLEECFRGFCAQEKDPLFVSVTSGFHPYHNGPEHRYFLKRHGCDVRDEYYDPSGANKMAVVIDSGSYEHGKTAYHELTLFGPSEESYQYSCGGNIQIDVLKR